MFSNKQNDHYILANSGYKYLATPSHTITINSYCHDTPRPRRLYCENVFVESEVQRLSPIYDGCLYPELSNTIAGSCCLIIAIHSSSASAVNPLQLKRPPSVPTTRPIGKFIWKPFNRPEHAISLARNNADFDKQDMWLEVSTLKLTQTLTEASSSNIPSIVLTPTTQCWSGRRWYQSMGSVQHSMPVPIWTSAKPISDSSLIIMTVIHTSEPFHPTNLFTASTLSTSSLTDSLNRHSNSASTPICLLAHPSGYSSKSTHIWCTLEIPTVNCFCQTNLPHK